jgi:hypothetical protein
MPFVYGNIYPEVQSATLLRTELRVLVDCASATDQLIQALGNVAVLRKYLADISSHRHVVITTIQLPPASPDHLVAILKRLDTHSIVGDLMVKAEVEKAMPNAPQETKRLLSIALNADTDCILTTDAEKLALSGLVEELSITIDDPPSMLRWCEVFSRGHEIPWSFREPMWGCPFSSFYALTGASQPLVELHAALCRQLQQPPPVTRVIVEYARSLAYNRSANIGYARDKILFYALQRRAARRRRLLRQSFWFEAGYHLNHYYLLLWGGVDQVCWIVNYVFDLGFDLTNRSHWREVGVTKTRFVNKVAEACPALGGIFRDEDLLKWFKMLRGARHFAAHHGTVTPSKLVKPPKREITETELQQAVDEEIQELRGVLPEQMLGPVRAQVEQLKRLAAYEEVLDDVVEIEMDGERWLISPILNVQWDFDHYIQFVERCAQECLGRLRAANRIYANC